MPRVRCTTPHHALLFTPDARHPQLVRHAAHHGALGGCCPAVVEFTVSEVGRLARQSAGATALEEVATLEVALACCARQLRHGRPADGVLHRSHQLSEHRISLLDAFSRLVRALLDRLEGHPLPTGWAADGELLRLQQPAAWVTLATLACRVATALEAPHLLTALVGQAGNWTVPEAPVKSGVELASVRTAVCDAPPGPRVGLLVTLPFHQSGEDVDLTTAERTALVDAWEGANRVYDAARVRARAPSLHWTPEQFASQPVDVQSAYVVELARAGMAPDLVAVVAHLDLHATLPVVRQTLHASVREVLPSVLVHPEAPQLLHALRQQSLEPAMHERVRRALVMVHAVRGVWAEVREHRSQTGDISVRLLAEAHLLADHLQDDPGRLLPALKALLAELDTVEATVREPGASLYSADDPRYYESKATVAIAQGLCRAACSNRAVALEVSTLLLRVVEQHLQPRIDQLAGARPTLASLAHKAQLLGHRVLAATTLGNPDAAAPALAALARLPPQAVDAQTRAEWRATWPEQGLGGLLDCPRSSWHRLEAALRLPQPAVAPPHSMPESDLSRTLERHLDGRRAFSARSSGPRSPFVHGAADALPPVRGAEAFAAWWLGTSGGATRGHHAHPLHPRAAVAHWSTCLREHGLEEALRKCRFRTDTLGYSGAWVAPAALCALLSADHLSLPRAISFFAAQDGGMMERFPEAEKSACDLVNGLIQTFWTDTDAVRRHVPSATDDWSSHETLAWRLRSSEPSVRVEALVLHDGTTHMATLRRQAVPPWLPPVGLWVASVVDASGPTAERTLLRALRTVRNPRPRNAMWTHLQCRPHTPETMVLRQLVAMNRSELLRPDA